MGKNTCHGNLSFESPTLYIKPGMAAHVCVIPVLWGYRQGCWHLSAASLASGSVRD